MPSDADRSIRIANASGFYGDRFSAVREQVEGGAIDVLTGDYLAEITMMILARERQRRGAGGFARSFVRQVEEVLATCLERGIRVVANAGGLDPAGCRDALAEAARRQGLAPRIAIVHGDDLLPRLDALRAEGGEPRHLDSGVPLSVLDAPLFCASAYLGCRGIVTALERGADIVITGRVTDSALALGPAAWHFGWADDDWDRLAGGVIAGHVLECGTQATGGNYSFFHELDRLSNPGFPVAEVHADGSFVLTKHPGTGGAVTAETVIAQLVYEIASPAYATPDVTADFASVTVDEEGPDRVRVGAARGAPPPSTLKVSVQHAAGYRNEVDVLIGGLAAAHKARRFEELFWERAGDRARFRETRSDRFDAADGTVRLRLAARSDDAEPVGRAFAAAAFDLALGGPPGVTFGAPPSDATPCGATWPGTIDRALVPSLVEIDGESIEVPHAPVAGGAADAVRVRSLPDAATLPALVGQSLEVELGTLCGARSGDKGGDANLGLWVRDPALLGWLRETVTIERLRGWLPEPFDGPIERYELPPIGALNFVLRGYLGDGGAASLRLDSQAKLLAEQVRARTVLVDRAIVDLARRARG